MQRDGTLELTLCLGLLACILLVCSACWRTDDSKRTAGPKASLRFDETEFRNLDDGSKDVDQRYEEAPTGGGIAVPTRPPQKTANINIRRKKARLASSSTSAALRRLTSAPNEDYAAGEETANNLSISSPQAVTNKDAVVKPLPTVSNAAPASHGNTGAELQPLFSSSDDTRKATMRTDAEVQSLPSTSADDGAPAESETVNSDIAALRFQGALINSHAAAQPVPPIADDNRAAEGEQPQRLRAPVNPEIDHPQSWLAEQGVEYVTSNQEVSVLPEKRRRKPRKSKSSSIQATSLNFDRRGASVPTAVAASRGSATAGNLRDGETATDDPISHYGGVEYSTYSADIAQGSELPETIGDDIAVGNISAPSSPAAMLVAQASPAIHDDNGNSGAQDVFNSEPTAQPTTAEGFAVNRGLLGDLGVQVPQHQSTGADTTSRHFGNLTLRDESNVQAFMEQGNNDLAFRSSPVHRIALQESVDEADATHEIAINKWIDTSAAASRHLVATNYLGPDWIFPIVAEHLQSALAPASQSQSHMDLHMVAPSPLQTQSPSGQLITKACPPSPKTPSSSFASDQNHAQTPAVIRSQFLGGVMAGDVAATSTASSHAAPGVLLDSAGPRDAVANNKKLARDLPLSQPSRSILLQRPGVQVKSAEADALLETGLNLGKDSLIHESTMSKTRVWEERGPSKISGLGHALVAKYTDEPRSPLEHEARILLNLKHNNVVACYLFRKNAKTARQTLLLEKLDNPISRENRGFKPRSSLNVMRHMASALTYLHSKNLVHNDIKPDNIWRRFSTRDYVLVGFESCAEAGTPPFQLLEEVSLFRAPEVSRRFLTEERILSSDGAADIYSLFLSIGYAADWKGLREAIKADVTGPDFFAIVKTLVLEEDKALDWWDMATKFPHKRPTAATLTRRIEILESLSTDPEEIWPDDIAKRYSRNVKLSTKLMAEPQLLEEVRDYHLPLYRQHEALLQAHQSSHAEREKEGNDDSPDQASQNPGAAEPSDVDVGRYAAEQPAFNNVSDGMFSDRAFLTREADVSHQADAGRNTARKPVLTNPVNGDTADQALQRTGPDASFVGARGAVVKESGSAHKANKRTNARRNRTADGHPCGLKRMKQEQRPTHADALTQNVGGSLKSGARRRRRRHRARGRATGTITIEQKPKAPSPEAPINQVFNCFDKAPRRSEGGRAAGAITVEQKPKAPSPEAPANQVCNPFEKGVKRSAGSYLGGHVAKKQMQGAAYTDVLANKQSGTLHAGTRRFSGR